MNIKASSLVAILALAAAPASSYAGDPASNAAFDACIKAFTTNLATHAVRDTKVDTSYSSSTMAYWRPSSYTIELRARGVESGSIVSKANCFVDNKGVVLIQDESSQGYSVEVAAADR